MDLIRYCSGEKHEILLMDCGSKKHDVQPFLQTLKASGNADYLQILALLDRTARHGVVWNDLKAKNLAGTKGLCEFKARGGTRILWFFDDKSNRVIVCTHAFVKKQQRTPVNEIERAEARRKLFYQN